MRIITAYPFYPAWCVRKGYSSWFYRIQNIAGVKIFRCPLWIPRNPSGLKRLIHLFSFAMSTLPILIGQIFWKPDIFWVVEPTSFCVPGTLLAARLSKAKCWLHIQDFEIDIAFTLGFLSSSKLWAVIKKFESWIMCKFDRVSAISERMTDQLKKKNIRQSKLISFPNWVDIKKIYPQNHNNPMRDALGIPKESIVALYSGTWGEKEGLEIIIEGARKLQKIKKIVFVFCGEGLTYRHFYNSTQDLNNIRWINLQPEDLLNDLLNIADIHLLPQRSETADLVMPSKLTGMLASGRAILAMAHNDTYVSNLLKNKGIVIPPANIDEFISALRRLSDDEENRILMGSAGRQYAVDYLDKEIILSKFEEELLSVKNEKLTRSNQTLAA